MGSQTFEIFGEWEVREKVNSIHPALRELGRLYRKINKLKKKDRYDKDGYEYNMGRKHILGHLCFLLKQAIQQATKGA